MRVKLNGCIFLLKMNYLKNVTILRIKPAVVLKKEFYSELTHLL